MIPSWEGLARWSNPGHYLLILSWRLREEKGTCQNTDLPPAQGVFKQCSQDWSNQPHRQAIWLHQHSMNKECQLRGRTLLPVPPVPLVWHSLPSQWGDQPILQRVFHQGDSLHPELKPFVLWNSVESSGRCFLKSNQPGLIVSFQSVNYVWWSYGYRYSYSVMCFEIN